MDNKNDLPLDSATLSDTNANINKTNDKKEFNYLMLWSVGLSLFWVVFIWGFWGKGIYALGINAAIFLFLTLGLLFKLFPDRNLFRRENFIWLIPLCLIILSFAVYENPFIKIINLFVYPVLVLIFYNYAMIENKANKIWGLKFFLAVLNRAFFSLDKIGESIKRYIDIIIAGKGKRAVIKRVIFGLILFIILAMTIIIPLLSSADKIFAQRIDFIYEWFREFFSMTYIAKLIIFSILSIFFLSLSMAWKKSFEYKTENYEFKIDSIIAGIVVGGILILYLFFLFIQLQYLWVRSLPIDFKTTESLVKSGFWELLTLSIINILIFFFSFKKTNNLVEKVLMVFTVASFLLLTSAAYRMGLYVTYYGFSYEKFYASYTVIFCAVLLIWLFMRFFSKHRIDIIKFVAFLFLWMYAAVAVFPVEHFIVRLNIALSKNENSRINLYELSMLSGDVLKLIKQESNKELAYSRNQSDENKSLIEPIDWQPWLNKQERLIKDKAWYEMNFNSFLYHINSR